MGREGASKPGTKRLICTTSLCEDRASRSNLAVARQRDPGGYRSTWQSGGFLEGEVAWNTDKRFLAQHSVFRQHPVEIGAKPVGQVFRPDRSAKPARMKRPCNPVADLDPRHAIANGRDLAGAVGKRHDAELRRTGTAALRTIRSR
jgi:hypothetical protein